MTRRHYPAGTIWLLCVIGIGVVLGLGVGR